MAQQSMSGMMKTNSKVEPITRDVPWKGSVQPMFANNRGLALRASHVAASTAPPRIPLIVRAVADVRALRDNSRAIRRLPKKGLRVAIEGLEPSIARQLEARINAYVKACGCAEGGVAALVAMLAVVAWMALQMFTRGPRWSDLNIGVGGLLFCVLMGGLGKVIGLTIARRRFERSCSEVMRAIANN